MRYYDETASIASALELPGELGNVRRSTAAIHAELGDLSRARGDAREALRLHRASASAFDELDDLLVLAEVEGRAGRQSEVARLLSAARSVADTLGARSAAIAVALTSARLADRANDPAGVLRALHGAERAMMPGDFAAAGEAHALAARAYARRGMLDSAVTAGRRAIDAIEHVRGDIASEPLRRTLLADRSSVYADQVLALLRLGRTAEAFSVADAARSRGLAEYLASSREDRSRAGRVEQIGEGERLLREIDVLLAKLRSLDSVPARERGAGAVNTSVGLMARLERARAAYEALLARTGREHPRAAALLGIRATATDQVQRALDPDEALLEYLVTSDRVVLFVATRSALRTFEVAGGSAALADRVRLLRELWGSRGVPWRTGLPAAHALHETLLGDAGRDSMLRGVRRLVIVRTAFCRSFRSRRSWTNAPGGSSCRTSTSSISPRPARCRCSARRVPRAGPDRWAAWRSLRFRVTCPQVWRKSMRCTGRCLTSPPVSVPQPPSARCATLSRMVDWCTWRAMRCSTPTTRCSRESSLPGRRGPSLPTETAASRSMSSW
jgi:hypothetical protein